MGALIRLLSIGALRHKPGSDVLVATNSIQHRMNPCWSGPQPPWKLRTAIYFGALEASMMRTGALTSPQSCSTLPN
jgi:hypothetical protein